MKKIIACVLAALSVGLAASSCGSSEGTDVLKLKYDYDLSEYLELAEYKNLPAEGYAFQVTDEQIQQQILSTRAYYSRSTIVERPAQLGDIVYIDYVTTVNGEEIEGGSEEEYELTLGTGVFVEEFENAIVGASAGDHLSLDAAFPDPFTAYPEMSGMTAHYEITVDEVREQELPEYTEDFVRAYLGYDSCADFEAGLRVLLEKHYREIYYQFVSAQIWDDIMEGTVIKKYPEAELKETCDNMIAANQAVARAQGINFADYIMVNYQVSEEEFYQMVQEDAEHRIKEEMVGYAIARAENLGLTEEEYAERAQEYALDQLGMSSTADLESVYEKDSLRQRFLMDKVHERIVDLADVVIVEESN